MKNTSLIGLATALLLTTGLAQAAGDKVNNVIDQNLAKRPYQQAPSDAAAKEVDHWEAATLVTDEGGEVKTAPNRYQQLRIRMLGQRPYMEKSTD